MCNEVEDVESGKKRKRRTADGDVGGYTDAFAAPKE